jgi:hypothetical protein
MAKVRRRRGDTGAFLPYRGRTGNARFGVDTGSSLCALPSQIEQFRVNSRRLRPPQPSFMNASLTVMPHRQRRRDRRNAKLALHAGLQGYSPRRCRLASIGPASTKKRHRAHRFSVTTGSSSTSGSVRTIGRWRTCTGLLTPAQTNGLWDVGVPAYERRTSLGSHERSSALADARWVGQYFT